MTQTGESHPAFDEWDQQVGTQFNMAGDYVGLTEAQVRALFVEIYHAGQPEFWDGRRLYMSLASFQEGDAPFFFGHEDLIRKLLQRVDRARFVCVSGPSAAAWLRAAPSHS